MKGEAQIEHLKPVISQPLSHAVPEDHSMTMKLRHKLLDVSRDADLITGKLKGDPAAMSHVISARQALAKAHLALSRGNHDQAKALERKAVSFVDQASAFHVPAGQAAKQAGISHEEAGPVSQDTRKDWVLIKRIRSNIAIDRIRRTFRDLDFFTLKFESNSNALSLLDLSRKKLAQANLAILDKDYRKARKLADEAMAFVEQAESFRA